MAELGDSIGKIHLSGDFLKSKSSVISQNDDISLFLRKLLERFGENFKTLVAKDFILYKALFLS